MMLYSEANKKTPTNSNHCLCMPGTSCTCWACVCQAALKGTGAPLSAPFLHTRSRSHCLIDARLGFQLVSKPISVGFQLEAWQAGKKALTNGVVKLKVLICNWDLIHMKLINFCFIFFLSHLERICSQALWLGFIRNPAFPNAICQYDSCMKPLLQHFSTCQRKCRFSGSTLKIQGIVHCCSWVRCVGLEHQCFPFLRAWQPRSIMLERWSLWHTASAMIIWLSRSGFWGGLKGLAVLLILYGNCLCS